MEIHLKTTISTDLPKYLVPFIGIGLESLKNWNWSSAAGVMY